MPRTQKPRRPQLPWEFSPPEAEAMVSACGPGPGDLQSPGVASLDISTCAGPAPPRPPAWTAQLRGGWGAGESLLPLNAGNGRAWGAPEPKGEALPVPPPGGAHSLRDYQKVDEAEQGGQDEGEHHGAGEGLVLQLVVLQTEPGVSAAVPET